MIESLRVNDRDYCCDTAANDGSGILALRSTRALHRAVVRWPAFEHAAQQWARARHRCAHVIVVVNVVAPMPSLSSMRIVLAPVNTRLRLQWLEAWNATVGGAFSTLAYTHRQRTRSKPLWAATARTYAVRQHVLARASGDGELQFKCCVWLAYAECYDWRFDVARRWLRALRWLLLHDGAVLALVGVDNADALAAMVGHALRYVAAIERHTAAAAAGK
jgi:hypothetical protein